MLKGNSVVTQDCFLKVEVQYILETDRYHFLKPIPIFSIFFSLIFRQLPIFYWSPISIFQICLPIYSPIF